MITSVSQIVLDLAAFFFAKYSRWFVFFWFILRFAAQQQVGNSAGKILKMRIEWVMDIHQDKQLDYFNAVVVTGEFLGRISAIVFVFVIGTALGRHGYSFYTIRNVFLFVLGTWDLVCLACTMAIPLPYFIPESKLAELGIEVSSSDGDSFHSSRKRDDDHVPLMDRVDGGEDESTPSSRMGVGRDYFVGQDELEKAYEPDIELGEPKEGNCLVVFKNYFVDSAKAWWRNGPLVFSTLVFWTSFLLVSVINILLKFEVSEVGTADPRQAPTLDNLCNGMFINILQISVSEHGSTLIGVAVYTFVLSKIKPFMFFNKIFPVITASFMALFVTIFWKNSFGPVASAAVLGALYAGLYLAQTYSGNVAAAWCDPTIIAFAFAMQASFAQVLALVPSFFAAVKLPSPIVVVFCIIVAAALGLSSWWYTKKNKQVILLHSEPEMVNHDEIEFPTHHAVLDEDDLVGDSDPNSAPLDQFISPEDLED
jgi:hypothetical protein